MRSTSRNLARLVASSSSAHIPKRSPVALTTPISSTTTSSSSSSDGGNDLKGKRRQFACGLMPSRGVEAMRRVHTTSLRCNSPSLAAPPGTTAAGFGLGTTQLSPDIMLRCTIFDARGSTTSTSGVFKKSRLCTEHGLEPRDLRKIDSRVPNLVPTILARRGGILVNILHIRAMIKPDKVLLFDSYGSTDSQLHSAFVYNLQHNLRPHGNGQGHGKGEHGGLAYEFRALESILVSVLDALRIELGVVRGWTRGVLDELDDDVDREKLRTLLQVSRKLNAFLSRAKAVKNAVHEVLENEEDMALMYLSHPSPHSASPASSSSVAASSSASARAARETAEGLDVETHYSASNVDELELLLESFDKQVEEVVAETTQLHSDITNTQEVVELILDNNRNKLLALDLKTSIATMGISAGTLWAGLFGMNLKSHMEELDWAFAGVSGVAFGAVLLTAGIGLRRLERLRRVGLGQGQGQRSKKAERKKLAGVWLDRWKGKKEASTSGSGSEGGMWSPHGLGMAVPHLGGWHHPAVQPYPSTQTPDAIHQSVSWWPNPFHPSAAPDSAPPPHPLDPHPPQPTPAATASPAPAPPSSAASPPGAPGGDGVGALGMGLGSKWSGSSAKKRAKNKPTS